MNVTPEQRVNGRNDVMLILTSLLSVLLFTFHIADDIVRGFEEGNASNFGAFPIAVVWLYGALVLAGRRSGYVITLLGGILSAGIPYLHMRGKGVGGEFAQSDGAFFFIWTILALGIAGLLSAILSVHGLVSQPWRRPR